MRPAPHIENFSADRPRTLRAARSRRATLRRRSIAASIEGLESRALMAVLPPVATSGTLADITTGFSANGITVNNSAPSIVIDPSNPQKLVASWQATITGDNNFDQFVQAATSADGGTTWSTFFDSRSQAAHLDPTVATNPPLLRDGSDITVAMDANEHIYVLSRTHKADNSVGFLDLSSFTFGTNGVTGGSTTKTIGSWLSSDQILEPTMAVDANSAVYGDTNVNNIYVAWVTNTAERQPANQNPPLPNRVVMIASADFGTTFTPWHTVDDRQGNAKNASPHLIISQGTADGSVAPGQVTIAWDDFGSNATANPPTDVLRSDRVTSNVSALTAVGGPMAIADATDPGNSLPHVAGVTNVPINVAITDPNFTSLADLTVSLNLTHTNLDQLQIELVAPNGLPATILVQNRTDALGNPIPNQNNPQGISGANLGTTWLDTTFDDRALLAINNANAGGAPFTGRFRPEAGSLLANYAGKTAAQLNGQWFLRITDTRANAATNPPTVYRLNSVGLNFGSGLNTGADHTIASTTVRGALTNGAGIAAYPTTSAATPNGIGPGLTLAADNTTGAFSPYQGRIYAAFVNRVVSDTNPADNTDVYLVYSDNGGVSWSTPKKVNDDHPTIDGFSEGDRPQFMPAIAVDQTTGTLVYSYFDTRYDAAKARVATMVTTSIDGGSSFAASNYANPAKTATDYITGATLTPSPIPDNQSAGNPVRETTFGFGAHQALAVYGGTIYAGWSSNIASYSDLVSGTQYLTGGRDGNQRLSIALRTLKTAAGPRIISGTMGPVGLPGDGLNGNRGADGTPIANSIIVTFDRPVDSTTFGTGDVQVLFHDANVNDGFVSLGIVSVQAQDNGTYGATTFKIVFTPPSGSRVGTYSYIIGPNISDRVSGGHNMDQNANGVAAQGINDRFVIPTPSNGGGILSAPFDPNTLPLIVSGPYVASTHVAGAPTTGDNLVQNNTVSSIDLTFDRYMDAGTFTPSDILQIQGPSGVIPGPYTVTPVYNSTNVNISINANTTTTSTLAIPAVGGPITIGDLNVQVNLTHAHDADLTLTLIAPNGTRIKLAQGLGGAVGKNYTDTVFDSQAADPIGSGTAPFNGSFRPVGSLDVLNNTSTLANGGVWKLEIINAAGQVGTLNAWSLAVTPKAGTTAYATTFRVGFPQQELSGTYIVNLNSDIKSMAGDALDSNHNAGLDILRGTITPGGATVPVTYASTNVPVSIPDATSDGGTPPVITPGIATSTITIADDYKPTDVTVTLSITDPFDPDLEITLIAPNGTRITLVNQRGQGVNTANFQGTIFNDAGTTLIRNGGAPFNGGPYVPEQSLNAAIVGNGVSVNGTWTLEIKDHNTGNVGTLTAWSLTFKKPVPSSGLGEISADRTEATFRIFTEATNNALSSAVWTPVGPAANGSGKGRVGGIAVDPSDASGNTVYIGGATGGVWKTTNFLTNDSNGPTYIPLTSFGPTNSANIGGIAVVGRNSNPSQSIVFAATGDGDGGAPGAGILRSLDGGATWVTLDSSVNFDSNGNLLPMDSPLRDHVFVGMRSFKIVADPKLNPNGDAVAYVAFSGGNDGIWRTQDSGRTWKRMLAGEATDVAVDLSSGTGAIDPLTGTPSGNLQFIYAAIRGVGVFFSPNQGQSWSLMAGGLGTPLVVNIDTTPNTAVTVTAPISTPNGPKGRIVITTPGLTGDIAKDVKYQGWLYAFVSTPGGNSDGLYMTKDFGRNWTRVRIPTLPPIPNPNGGNAFPQETPTNNTSLGDYDPLSSSPSLPAQGNYDIAITIDPTNPNVVYLGGMAGGGLIRVDTTYLNDAHALVPFNETKPDGGKNSTATAGGVALANPADPAKLLPASQFNVLPTTTKKVVNATNFNNDGSGATWIPFNFGAGDFHRFVSYIDPLTGRSRIIAGDDHGVYTVADNNGTFDSGIGTADVPVGDRTGNLQIIQFYYGASQPTGTAFYGQAQDNGSSSSGNVLATGQIGWNTPGGDSGGIATDQTGSGTVYSYKWPCCGGNNTDFFQVNGQGRTNGLILDSQPGVTPDPEWPFLGTINFAVNPINGNQIMIGSAVAGGTGGRIFSTENQGQFWSVIAEPTNLDGTQSLAMAYGAPDPNGPAGLGNLDNFLYVGTNGGHIYITQTGGGGTGNAWTNVSAGLSGGAVKAIVTNPNRGSHEAYAVTDGGVFHIADSTAPGATWQNITGTGAGNLFSLTHNLFGDPNQVDTLLRNLTSLAVDWRYTIPTNFTNPSTVGTFPILYVGGNGGVFRSIDNGVTWARFPDAALNNTPVQAGDGGLFPVVQVNDLDLALGVIDPTTGRPNTASNNILLATTYGSGSYAIRLAPIVFPTSLGLDHNAPLPPAQGGSDSGNTPADQSDGRSNVTNPIIDGFSAQTAFGQVVTIKLYDLTDPTNPVQIGQGTTDAQGFFKVQVDPGHFLPDGSTDGQKTIGVQASDQNGTVGNMESIQYYLDTTPPTKPGNPDLQAGSDSPAPGDPGYVVGVTDTDNLTFFNGGTAATTPSFDIQSVEPSTTTVYLLRDGVIVNQVGGPGSGGVVTITDPGPIPDGDHIYTATQTDSAGNASVVSGSLKVTIDSTAPATPPKPSLLLDDDSGTQGDNTTSVTRPHLTGTAEPLSTILLYDSSDNLIGQLKVGASGTYSVQPTSPLPAGTNSLYVRSEDVAGNRSAASQAITLTILTATPPTPLLALVVTDDSGTVGDNITNVTKPRLIGSVVPSTGLKVVLVDAAGNPVSSPVIPAADGTFIIQLLAKNATTGLFSDPLADGIYPIRAKAYDVAGNASFSSTLNLTIDTHGPTSKPSLFLNNDDDTGARGDSTTSLRRPRLSGVTEPNSAIDLISVTPDGSGGFTNPVIRASGTADRLGNYNIQLPFDLTNGSIYLQTSVRDAAGNTGIASDVLKLTIDTTPGDYTADGKADLASYRPSQSLWIVYPSVIPDATATPGHAMAFNADFDGDGKADLVTVDPATDIWTIHRSTLGTLTLSDGQGGLDLPAVGDFNGDGKSDIAAYRPTTGQWFIKLTGVSGSNGVIITSPINNPTPAIPIPADYNGDGITDLATWATSTTAWTINNIVVTNPDSASPTYSAGPAATSFVGSPNLDVPVPADYDGDGKADIAIYRPTNGLWAILYASGGYLITTPTNQSGDIPAPADYDGDGKADRAVYRQGTSQWIVPYSGGGQKVLAVGTGGYDIPVLAPYNLRMAAITPSASVSSGARVASARFDMGSQAASFSSSSAPSKAPAATTSNSTPKTSAVSTPITSAATPTISTPPAQSSAEDLTPAQRHHQLVLQRAAARRQRQASILRGLAARFHKA